MPLKRGRDEVRVTTRGIEFLMEDGNAEILCRAAREMLRERFGSESDDADMEPFKAKRESIEQAASDKYDAGKIETGIDVMVIVTGNDMASPLSQKM